MTFKISIDFTSSPLYIREFMIFPFQNCKGLRSLNSYNSINLYFIKFLAMRTKMFFLIFFLIIFQQLAYSQTDKLGIRLNRAVSIAYHSDQVSLEKIDLDKNRLPKDITKSLGKDAIYKINENEDFKGYAYVGSAPSKEREFDYLILFNPDLTINLGKVLIYRESHGREIGAARWLDQFVGMSPSSTVKFGDNIDSISGATISARSMTRAVGKVLNIMGALDKNNLL